MPKSPTRRKAGTPPAGLKNAIAWLCYHPMSTDVMGLSMVAVVLIWGAFK
ncbi:hypothetical protein [Stutzerimonas kunmingensis]|jgi:NAD(P)H-dependent FMN reductase|nr:hypothetical protein [Stutzerimonas kunmingensis]|tara:strand:- start:2948 stop:3097 length:150 start_codon:yes stop_codon:yes gene_type:complete